VESECKIFVRGPYHESASASIYVRIQRISTYVCIYQISQSKLIKRALPLSRAETSESVLILNDAHTETRQRYSFTIGNLWHKILSERCISAKRFDWQNSDCLTEIFLNNERISKPSITVARTRDTLFHLRCIICTMHAKSPFRRRPHSVLPYNFQGSTDGMQITLIGSLSGARPFSPVNKRAFWWVHYFWTSRKLDIKS